MSDTSITYHLPLSVVRITGTRTTPRDACLEQQAAPSTEASTALLVVADPLATSAVQVHQGWFRQMQASLALTDDGRLSSASSESQGEVGTLVKGVVTTAATVAGSAVLAGRVMALRMDLKEDGSLAAPADEPVDRAHAAYREAHKIEAGLLESYSHTIASMEWLLADHLDAMSTSVPTKDQLAELHRLEIALSDARAQLERLEQHYKVWRASQVVTVVEKHQYDVPVDEAAQVTITFDGRVTIPDSARESRKAWDALGIVVEARSEGTVITPPASYALVPFGGVHLRQPRSVQVKTWRRSDTDPTRAELVSVERRLVVDSASQLSTVGFNTSIWAKRKTATTIAATGGLGTYQYSGDSAAGALGTTLSEVPGDVAAGLEQAAKLRAELTSLRTAKTEEALATTKRQLEQKQTQLSLDGLAATEGDYADLERLKQQKERLETSNAIIQLPTQAGSVEIAALNHDVELLKLQQELAALKAEN